MRKFFRIIDSSRDNKENITIFIIPDNTRLWYLPYKAHVEQRPFRFFYDWNLLSWNVKGAEQTAIQDFVLASDYIIDKDGGSSGEPYVQRFVNKARVYFSRNKDKFTLLSKIKWPDDSNILIFKRKHIE